MRKAIARAEFAVTPNPLNFPLKMKSQVKLRGEVLNLKRKRTKNLPAPI